ncbi:MAG: hypothetical protein WCP52_12845 [Bacteroidota bacterium]
MDDLTLSITDLKAKVEKLVNLHQQLKKDNERLTLDNIKLLNVIDEQKLQIEAVEKRNLELTINTKEEQQQVITETKEKINELVQEIENCIALLN